jgi:hypothetical protein
MAEVESVESQLKKLAASGESSSADLTQTVHSALTKLEEIKGGDDDAKAKKDEDEAGLADANAGLGTALRIVEGGDRTAPAQAVQISEEMGKAAREKIEAWQRYKSSELGKVNAALARAHREPLQIAEIEEQVHYAMTR